MDHDKRDCYGCYHCGMDMDMEPYCVRKEVLAKRTAETGQDYPWGLDTRVAAPLCQLMFWTKRQPGV